MLGASNAIQGSIDMDHEHAVFDVEPIEDPLSLALDASFPMTLAGSEHYTAALENASTVTAHDSWLDDSGMKLNPTYWASKGETPVGAMSQIDWTWNVNTGAPKSSSHANHPSATRHAKRLGSQLDEAARMGMIEYYDPAQHGSQTDFVNNIIPLAAIEKANGKIRMIVDPTTPGVNACMQTLPCQLTSVEEIFKQVKPTSVLGKRDLVNGFFHCVLSPDARRYMGLIHPVSKQLGRWVVLPQGTKQSPAIFCEVTNAANRIFNDELEKQGIKVVIFIYVDDFILVADSHADLIAAFHVMDKEAQQLGLEFNPDKDVGLDQPLHTLEALGIVIDAPNQELKLPEEKRAKYLSELQAFKSAYRQMSDAPRKPLEKLVGKLAFTSRVCRWGYLFIQELLDVLYVHPVPRIGSVTLTDGLWHDLSFWEDTLNHGSSWIGLRKPVAERKELHINPEDFTTQMYTDASKTYGAGGVLGDDIISFPWQTDTRDTHIGTLELLALFLCLQHWAHTLTGHTVLAWLDNVQAISAVNKGASRISVMRDILLDIAHLGMTHGFDLKAKHIPGRINPADAPSRGDTTPSTSWVFTEADKFNDPPAQIDCCAPVEGPMAVSSCTECFTVLRRVQDHIGSIQGKVLWATAPIAAADAVIHAIVSAWQAAPLTTRATIVVPEWTTATWYRKYMRRKHPVFTILHRYPEGARIFTRQGLANPAPAKWPVLVLRLGA